MSHDPEEVAVRVMLLIHHGTTPLPGRPIGRA
jgi:hypothetical protein